MYLLDRSPSLSGVPLCSAAIDAGDGHCLIRLRGELDLHSVPWLAEMLDRCQLLVRDELVLDLTAVHFCDLRGLLAVERATSQYAAARRRLVIAGARPLVQRVTRLAGLRLELLPASRSRPQRCLRDGRLLSVDSCSPNPAGYPVSPPPPPPPPPPREAGP